MKSFAGWQSAPCGLAATPRLWLLRCAGRCEMIRAQFTFPRGFLWGTASAAHQVEGGDALSDWKAWEAEPGRVLGAHTSARACEWLQGRYIEDFDRAAADGHNAQRLSVEWARIEPEPGRWDAAALQFYRAQLLALRARNITPMVTLCHFTQPLWFMERGGWETPACIPLFERYVQKVAAELGDLCSLWCTINEPNAYMFAAYVAGVFPPGHHNLLLAQQVHLNQLRAHAAAYHALHAARPDARVGWAQYLRGFEAARPGFPPDRWAAHWQHQLFNMGWVNAVHSGRFRMLQRSVPVPECRGTCDWLGVNYYTRDLVAFDLRHPLELFGRRQFAPDDVLSEQGFIASHPAGLFRALGEMQKFGWPMFVTENGVEDAPDNMRPAYLLEHLRALWQAVCFNFPVHGYFHWSLVDNFEWERGWTQRFGLYALDVDTQVRTPRSSAKLYAEICRANAISAEIAQRYAPPVAASMFPGAVLAG